MIRKILGLLALIALPTVAIAQGTSVQLGSQDRDTNAPVEITAEKLAVDQDAGIALYTGDVVVIQNDMRLAAPRVLVTYSEAKDEITNIEATGGVIMVTADEEAESDRADYDVEAGVVVMTGDVLLNQGLSALTAQEMVVDLDKGTANMVGRVKSVFQSEDN